MIFISHSRDDQSVAAELEAALRDRGVATWADFLRIPIGERFVEEIAGALSKASVFLLVSSAASARSYWVSREVACAARLRASGQLDSLVRLDLDGNFSFKGLFDCTFNALENAVEHVRRRNQYVARVDWQLDQHLVDVAYYQQRPTPRVWLGFSSELAAIDRWFFGAGTGLWVSGLGGAGKSSLVSVWIAALRMIGYERPLNVSIRQWDFYETPDPAAALNRIHPWVNSSGQGIQILFLDGMDELTHPPVREICELVTRYPGLKVLVTSRQSMPEEYSTAFYGLSLGSLDREQSELLASRLGVDQHVTEKLFNLLHGHPLSISLAASLVENGYDSQDIVRTIERTPN